MLIMAAPPFAPGPLRSSTPSRAELPALIEEYSQKPGFYIPPSLEEVLSHSYGLPAEEDLTQQQGAGGRYRIPACVGAGNGGGATGGYLDLFLPDR